MPAIHIHTDRMFLNRMFDARVMSLATPYSNFLFSVLYHLLSWKYRRNVQRNESEMVHCGNPSTVYFGK